MNIRDSTYQPLAPTCTGFMHQHNIYHSGLLTDFTPFSRGAGVVMYSCSHCLHSVVDIAIFAPDDSPHCCVVAPLKNGPESNQRPMDTTSDRTSSTNDSTGNMTSPRIQGVEPATYGYNQRSNILHK
ncbi:hypothetical protein T07_6519 [Trichinella nelsoni]|uniref:Uncharacterized protein n=1 Tax=Trichinella nelsoni TaxID=6336 RepID=A0A0V0SH91_9BILA|nr:hypothetical protein T07_6519 [Trichinella nelsoni]